MALQTFKWGAVLPMWFNGAGSGHSTSHVMNSSGHKVAMIFRVPVTGSITKVGFRVGERNYPADLKISLQTVSSGNPTGTLYGGSAASGPISPSALTFHEGTLATPASATEGDIIAAVVEWNSDSMTGDLVISQCSVAGYQAFPYTALYTTSWARNSNIPILSIAYGSSYENAGTFPTSNQQAVAFDSADSPNEYAVKFSFPFAYRFCGVWLHADLDYNTDIVLYASDGSTVLDTVSLLASERGATNVATYFIPFTSRVLEKDTAYRVSVKPTQTGASNCTIYRLDVNNVSMMDGLSGGPGISLSTKAAGENWIDVPTARISMGIFFDQLSDNVSGGGGGAGVSRGKFINAGGV